MPSGKFVYTLFAFAFLVSAAAIITGCKPPDPKDPNSHIADWEMRSALNTCKAQGRVLGEYSSRDGDVSFKCLRDDGIGQ